MLDMNSEEMLAEETRNLCKDIGRDYNEIWRELLDFIGSNDVADYCITRGPYPDFPTTIADCFVLGESCLYDYELRQEGNLRHVIPLNMIHGIGEKFNQLEGKPLLAVYFLSGAIGGVVIQDRLDNKEQLRRFSNSVKNKLIEKRR